jgi:hypothetical protein
VDKFLIWKVTPDRDVVIDAKIDGWAQHRFKAQRNKDDAEMTLAAKDLAYDSDMIISNLLGPTPTYPDTIETTLAVDEVGKYNITASANYQGVIKSVSWDWFVGEQFGSGSTGFLLDEGLYLHLCQSDLENILGDNNTFASIIWGFFQIILKSTAMGAIGTLVALLTIEILAFYAVAYNPEDISLDVFIPTTSLQLMQVANGPLPIPIPIRIGKHDLVLIM